MHDHRLGTPAHDLDASFDTVCAVSRVTDAR
jgi:hypothetical protein